MNRNVQLALEQVERAAALSKQPRFGKKVDKDVFFSSVLNWVNRAYLDEPPYKEDSRSRDKWLVRFWKQEPHLAGVISSVNAIDSNRGWVLTGGRNQVMRFLEVFREAEDGAGWRQYISMQSSSFYSTDMGALTEVGRDGPNGPLRQIWHVDPTLCYLTGDRDRPLHYNKSKNAWRQDDFFRLVSLRNIEEQYHGLGFCAVSRVLEMSKIMLAIYGYQAEQLGAKAPKGLLLLQNISQDQWQEAMKTREAAMDSEMRKYYNAVAVIAQQGIDSIDAKLVALSNLPEGFDLEQFTNLLMYAYALCFNYDPIEFWPVLAGQLGRGRETDIQHRKGTGKGGLNFMLAFQDQISRQLPSTLLFEFEQRDQEGVLLDAAVAQAWANVAATLYAGGSSSAPGPAGGKGGDGEPAQTGVNNPGQEGGKDNQSENNPKDQRPAAGQVAQPQKTGMLTLKEVRQLLASNGVIPASWTEEEEEVAATDAKNLEKERERLLTSEPLRRAIYQFPDEPIVQYKWPQQEMRILFRRGKEMLSATRYTLLKPLALIPDFSKPLEVVAEADLGAGSEENNEVLSPGDRLDQMLNQPPKVRRIEGGFNIYRGDTEPLKVTVKDSKKQEVNVAAASQIWYTVYEKESEKPLLQKELGRGISVKQSVITVEFEPEDTLDLFGNYFHSLKVVDDLGRTYTVYHGQMAVFKETVDA